ncbi:hypothetical protein QBC44DRAFT_356589 [Cladorrhinum sp. PSN332]|nr:hypothetical protein QBC44DRAFT_356589 [Cladorrhinum sp. PSN332]
MAAIATGFESSNSSSTATLDYQFEPIRAPMAWDGRQHHVDEFTYQWSEQEIAEIDQALAIFKFHSWDGNADGTTGSRGSNKVTAFHNDPYADMLALHVQGQPAQGGAIKVSSSWNIYNLLCVSRPETLQTLMRPSWKFEG